MAAIDDEATFTFDDPIPELTTESPEEDSSLIDALAEPVIEEAVYVPSSFGRDSPGIYLGPPVSQEQVLLPPQPRTIGGSALDASTLTAIYLQQFGRPPDTNEMMSDLDNARRYGDAGVIRGIQLRAGNVAGSGVRGDEFLPSLSAQQDAVVMNFANGIDSPTAISTATFGTEGVRDVLGSIVGVLPIPGADFIGDLIRGGAPGFSQPRLPMPGGGSQPRLPAPRTPPIIDIPVGRAPGGMSRGARAAAIAAAAAAAGLSVQQFLAMHPELRRRHRMNVLNQHALRRAFRRVDGFGRFVKHTIVLEKHAPRPKKRGRRK
jgi:hypothetical protein